MIKIVIIFSLICVIIFFVKKLTKLRENFLKKEIKNRVKEWKNEKQYIHK